MATEQNSQADQERGRRKTRTGTVVSDKMNKTVVVAVERRYAHPLYGKQVTRTKKYHAHDENNDYNVGDLVRIVETRPLSKLKRWRVVEVIERAK
ncbi:MAG: 30S ribosomal protein S17 [Gemmatimonadota bacterium]